jgi:hypothetical protein
MRLKHLDKLKKEIEMRSIAKQELPKTDLASDEFEWIDVSKFNPRANRDGVNLVVSSSAESREGRAPRITFSLSDALLAKLRWRIGDKVAIGFSNRDGRVVVGMKLAPQGRTISHLNKCKIAQGMVTIPYNDAMPIVPIKHTKLEESDFDFSRVGLLVFPYPQNAEINA